MKRLDELESAILAGARRARTPPPALQERVRARVLSAIAAGAVVPDVNPGLLERFTGAAGDALESLGEGPTQVRVLVGVAALSAVGVGGYALGLEAGQSRGRASPVPVAVRPRLEDAPALVVPSASPGALPAEIVEPTLSARSPRALSSSSPRSATSAAPAFDPSEELRALRRIERAQREKNPRLALALLNELDRSVPQGKLQEEREAARTVASCELDDAASVAQSRAAEFTARYSNSVYASRVQQACGARSAGERNTAPAETDQDK